MALRGLLKQVKGTQRPSSGLATPRRRDAVISQSKPMLTGARLLHSRCKVACSARLVYPKVRREGHRWALVDDDVLKCVPHIRSALMMSRNGSGWLRPRSN